ncbi:Variant surface glycoprotein [Trypanosoma congolense IL3000]|uniref:Variant surface glycoprotein n=1 Tax=Trypanosoma congolense (strain IL3000) TaxID=1068625 RepID=F9WDE6_TRYCI|nr:Variant surface glycoprotein [Trypanosoma congolense IL3000]
MRMVKIWMAVLVFVRVGSTDGAGEKKEYNKEEHRALCDFLKIALGTWGDQGSGLSEPLKAALKTTIFGFGSREESIEKLKSFPADYLEAVKSPGSRATWCGGPYHGGEDNGHSLNRWSGHSAPHDLVCLCTAGNYGWPVNETSPDNTLCGRSKEDLMGNKNEGWGSLGAVWDPNLNDLVIHDKGEAQIQATWSNVVTECLKGETGKDLKQALKTFIGKLNRTLEGKDRYMYRLGEGSYSKINHDACTGSSTYGVCVGYFPNRTNTKTWWKDLQNAFDVEEQQKRRAEEDATRRQQEHPAQKDEPQTAALTSARQTTNQTEQQRNDKLHEAIRKYNLTSGTPISQPTSWLLSATILI